MATRERERDHLEMRRVESFLVVYMWVLLHPMTDAKRQLLCPHKGLMANWPHHNIVLLVRNRSLDLPTWSRGWVGHVIRTQMIHLRSSSR
jgi:hypothetical protein